VQEGRRSGASTLVKSRMESLPYWSPYSVDDRVQDHGQTQRCKRPVSVKCHTAVRSSGSGTLRPFQDGGPACPIMKGTGDYDTEPDRA
jgi:hypothetical protein